MDYLLGGMKMDKWNMKEIIQMIIKMVYGFFGMKMDRRNLKGHGYQEKEMV